jgi:hypothetical protein
MADRVGRSLVASRRHSCGNHYRTPLVEPDEAKIPQHIKEPSNPKASRLPQAELDDSALDKVLAALSDEG